MSQHFLDDLIDSKAVPGLLGKRLQEFEQLAMWPLYPWGQVLFELILKRSSHVKGDWIEAGVGLGGTSLFLGKLAQSYGKKLYCVDSFKGLPPEITQHDNDYFVTGDFAGEAHRESLLSRFQAHISARGLEKTMISVPGYFKRAFKKIPKNTKLAFAHIDADLYSSTIDALEWIYPRLQSGGCVALDDFFHPSQGVLRACADYFNGLGETPVYQVVFPSAVLIFKGSTRTREPRYLDGNHYSFSILRQTLQLKRKLASMLIDRQYAPYKAEIESLVKILSRRTDTPDDMYQYVYFMRDLWQGLAVGHSNRAPIGV